MDICQPELKKRQESLSNNESVDTHVYKSAADAEDINQNSPTVLWNAMVHPLLNTTIYGVIWYQGQNLWFLSSDGYESLENVYNTYNREPFVRFYRLVIARYIIFANSLRLTNANETDVKLLLWQISGESNAGAPYLYRCRFPVMIFDWRKNFNLGSDTDSHFPFGFVQVP